MTELFAEAPRFFSYYNLLLLGRAFVLTALLSFAGNALGLLAGFALAVLRQGRIVRWPPLRWLATAYVELFRRIPFLVMLMIVFFVFQYSGVDVSLFAVAMTTLGLSSSAFLAEIIRAGLQSVHPNQWDAAETMNMSGMTAMRLVILPQAWNVILPPALTQSVGLIKSTSIVSQIGLMELTFAAKVLNQRGFSAGICFGTILMLYFALCWPLNLLAARLEYKLALPHHR
jgi:polar amino acid transport system permease protein